LISVSKENRRQARVQGVQHLYSLEMRGAWSGEATGEPAPEIDGALVPFAEALTAAALARREDIDRLLVAALQNWDLRRLGAVDRAILRLAVAEMLTQPDIPAAVTINEAIEIARHLATAESARFANGVLDRVRKEIGRDPHTQA
jgi:N utilization substance protein B